MRGLREKYEVHHGVTILDSSLVSAATLAHRYLTSRKMPDSAIDLIDEAAAAVRVARESQPEVIDALERKKLQIEVEIKALEKDKKDKRANKENPERLQLAKKELAKMEDELSPLKSAYDAMKQRSEQIQVLRQKIDDLKAKAERAERNYDLATAADLRHYSIPDTIDQLEKAEAAKQSEEAAKGNLLGEDIVSPDAIAEIGKYLYRSE